MQIIVDELNGTVLQNVLIVGPGIYENIVEGLEVSSRTWTPPVVDFKALEALKPLKKRGRYWESPKGYKGNRRW